MKSTATKSTGHLHQFQEMKVEENFLVFGMLCYYGCLLAEKERYDVQSKCFVTDFGIVLFSFPLISSC